MLFRELTDFKLVKQIHSRNIIDSVSSSKLMNKYCEVRQIRTNISHKTCCLTSKLLDKVLLSKKDL